MSSRRSHIIALVATLLFHAAVVVALLCIYLRYNPAAEADRTWPPVDSAEVLFGGEYVMIGDTPEAAESADEPAPAETEQAPAPQPQAEALDNAGKPAPTPAPVITSKQPSPAKAPEAKTKDPTGPSKAELEAAEKARREQEQREAIASRVSFGNNGAGGSGSGKAGSPDGNASQGAVSGKPGFNLGGRTIDSWEKPSAAPLGTIVISVTVDRQGHVTQAVYASGTGAAAASTKARNECIRAARASKFSVDLNAPASQKGTITYNFR